MYTVNAVVTLKYVSAFVPIFWYGLGVYVTTCLKPVPKLRKIKLIEAMHLICFVLNDVQELVIFELFPKLFQSIT
jgi:hypothetical protein